MRIIDVRNHKPERLTVMLYGPSRSGKTLTAATFPRPLFLADAMEGGWITLQTMDKSLWLEADRPPEVRAIERPVDMMTEINNLEMRLKNKPGDIKTLVIDSLTFYADMFFTVIEREASENPTKSGKINKFDLYSKLNSHLRALMLKAHSIPGINVVWLALEKEPANEGQDGGILLSGQQASKSPAACALWLYQRAFSVGTEIKYEIRTKRFGVFPAGGRFGNILPDPIEPNYNALAKHIFKEEGRAVIVEQKRPVAPVPIRRAPVVPAKA